MQKRNIEIGRKKMEKWIKGVSRSLPTELEYSYDGKNEIYQVPVNHRRRLKKIWNTTGSLREINNYLKKYNTELKYEDEPVYS